MTGFGVRELNDVVGKLFLFDLKGGNEFSKDSVVERKVQLVLFVV